MKEETKGKLWLFGGYLSLFIMFVLAILLLPSVEWDNCTDDCCYPNNCPYNNYCMTKQDKNCINPENDLSYLEEIEKGIKQSDWDLN